MAVLQMCLPGYSAIANLHEHHKSAKPPSGWISSYAHKKQFVAIAHPCPNINGGLIKIRVWMNNYIIYKSMVVITYL